MDNISVLKIDHFQKGANEAVFYVNTLEKHLLTSHIHLEKPHRHNFYATILFTKGSGIHEIDFNSHIVKPGSVFLLSPGQIHHWELSEDTEGFIFFHTRDFYDMNYVKDTLRQYPFFSSITHPRTLYINNQQQDSLSQLFIKMLSEVNSSEWNKNQYILSLITQIYIEINRIFGKITEINNENSGTYMVHFKKFENLVEKNFKQEKSPSKYAEWLNINPKHLNRITQTTVHKTTLDVIIERVILEAKRMLMYTDNNFNEVAYFLGYDDYSHFVRIFKKKEGITPSQFIKKYNL